MDRLAPSGVKCRGIKNWMRWGGVICLLPLLGFALSNIWLVSPWGCRWMAGKIQQRYGAVTRIGGASWSPWNGLTLRDVTIAQPANLHFVSDQPLLSIRALRIKPVWHACLHRKLEMATLEIDSPKLVLSVELLAHLAKQQAVPVMPLAAVHTPVLTSQPAGPAIAALQTTHESAAQSATNPPDNAATNIPSPLAQTVEATPSVTTGNSQPPATPPTSKPPAHTPDRGSKPLEPTFWVFLKHASLRIVAPGSNAPVAEVCDLTTDLPLAGKAARATLSLASVNMFGKPLVTDLHTPLTWDSPVLSLSPVTTMIGGVKLLFAAKLAMLNNLPMQFEVAMPDQPVAPLDLPGGGQITMDHFASSGWLRGLLLVPSTWQGQVLAGANAIAIKQGEHHLVFDRADCVTVLQGSVLSCLDLRCISDELALLGNATLFADGRAAASLRLVASPDNAVAIVRKWLPAAGEMPNLTPMSTPQRCAFDLAASGPLDDLQLQLGHDGPSVPLKKINH